MTWTVTPTFKRQMGLLQSSAERRSWDICWRWYLNETYLGISLFSGPCHKGESFFSVYRKCGNSQAKTIFSSGKVLHKSEKKLIIQSVCSDCQKSR